MIDTLVDATDAKCPSSNRTVKKFFDENTSKDSGQYTLYDKANGKTVVGLDPFRKTNAGNETEDVPRNIEKRSALNEKEYFDPHLYLKYVQSSSHESNSDIKTKSISEFTPSTRRVKDSDPKSYIPPKQSSKKNIDPKSSAQNNMSLRYQSTIPNYVQPQWKNPSLMGSIPRIQTNPSQRILPSYSTWPIGVMNTHQTLLHSNTVPYLTYPVYTYSGMQTVPIVRRNFCYPFCHFNYYYSING